MLRYILVVLCCIPFFANTQPINWAKIKRNSAETFVYKITADQAEKFIKQDSIPVDVLLTEIPFRIFKIDSVDTDILPVGQFVLLKIIDNEIVATMFGKTNLVIYPVMNEQLHLIEVRDVEGNNINNAEVWVDGKKTKWVKASGNYELVQKKLPKKSFVKIFTNNDTAFMEFKKENNYSNNSSVFKQKLNYWKYKPIVRNMIRLPLKFTNGILYLITKEYKYRRNYQYTYSRRNKNRRGSIGTKGYMVFNQPKYKLTDTVKFKAYIIDKKGKQYDKAVEVYLNYYARNKYNHQLLTTLQPSSKGSYVYEFALHDSLFNDVTYTIALLTKKDEKQIMNGNFKTEDYVLDEVSKYNVRSSKEVYHIQDSLHFYASAKDANDLPLLDGKVKFYLLVNDVNSYKQDSVYVKDTLAFWEKKLLTEGETKFSFAAKDLPKANLAITARCMFMNSNNEIQERTINVSYEETNKEIRAKIVGDTVYAEYYENEISTKALGELHIQNDKDFEHTQKIAFPYQGKINPFADTYNFKVDEKNGAVVFKSIEANEHYHVDFNRINKHDTAGFVLYNPLKMPINYFVYDGNKLLASVKSSEEKIVWEKRIKNPRKIYTLKYNYLYAGKQVEKTESVALLYKLVNINIVNKDKVFPGQKDSITVEVKDYKGKPVNNMNLTAVSYNTQFSKDIHVKEPPYLAHYKSTAPLWKRGLYKDEDYENVYISKKCLLGKHPAWLNKFGLDSMVYYQMLFPDTCVKHFANFKNDFFPEVGVYVVEKGVPQPIYILYLNRQPYYYDVTTVKMPYSFYTTNNNTQIGIRLWDKYLELDSIYLQPNYRHKLVFDLDKLPPKAKVIPVNNFYSNEEKYLIERTTWQLNKNFTNAYVWQNWKVAEINNNASNYSTTNHLIGPFNAYDSMHYFQKNLFDMHYRFEPGYEYSLSDKILRLEKKEILQLSTKLINNVTETRYYIQPRKNFVWNTLADTIRETPTIVYTKPKEYPNIYITSSYQYVDFFSVNNLKGNVRLTFKNDTVISYMLLVNNQTKDFIVTTPRSDFFSLPEGNYNLFLITPDWNVAQTSFIIKEKATLYFNLKQLDFKFNKIFIDSIAKISKPQERYSSIEKSNNNAISKIDTFHVETNNDVIYYGKSYIKGTIKDAKGKLPIAYASVIIKGTSLGVSANVKGEFMIKDIAAKKYTLVVSIVGYATKEIVIEVETNNTTYCDIYLQPQVDNMQEVVVTTALGETRVSKVLGYSTVKISGKEISSANQLQGKVAGLMINANDGMPGSDAKIILRGINSISSNNQPLYVVDGILYDEMPKELQQDNIESMDVLKGADATSVYGTRAANGAVVIKTKNTLTLRTKFRDYAFWKPELFTNKQGKVSFEVTYPDNITSWQTFVLGMDKKRRMGKAVAFTKAYKPVMAQLSLPQFLIEDDEVNVVAKVMNYTQDVYAYQYYFSVQNNLFSKNNSSVSAAASNVQKILLKSPLADTLKLKFNIETTTGFKDGEERKIPIFNKGIEETIGNFWMLNKDTVIQYEANSNANSIEINAEVNTLDILLKEIEHLKKYPFYCMEQTSSKLKGLLFEKQIKQQLHQSFKEEKDINFLINKLQKAQNFDGSWGWWEGGKANIYITNYVLNALLIAPENELIKSNIRNGLLYLQNQLPALNKDELLTTLVTMNNAKHVFDYSNYFNKINFDSMTLHQQWQYVKLKQQLKKDYSREIDTLLKKATYGMLGSISWGTQNYLWYNNHTASTIIAYEVLGNDEKYKHLQPAIMQFFITERKNGYWANTVESANILAAILPNILAENKDFLEKPELQINGDTNCVIKDFPFNKKLSANIQHVTFTKSAGGLMYLTAFQKRWNKNPNTVDDKFVVNTYFAKNENKQSVLSTGEKVNMIVEIEALKDAEYVMIEVPIPAGCIYGAKNKGYYEYREYNKNKVSIFVEKLHTGKHQFIVELEPRYTGTFTLNAAKAELMYFPTFYGRNENRKMNIEE